MPHDVKLGQLQEAGQQRDAVHIAVAPVIAAEQLYPGDHVGFIGGNTETVGAHVEAKIGIVDPFLTIRRVQPGDRFFVFLYPQSITSLRHDWTHPAFEAAPNRPADDESRRWIADYAKTLGLTADELVDAGRDYVDHGEYLILGGRFEGEHLRAEFWTHYERVTGKTVESGKRESFFSCSC